ncbi:Thiolase-like protein [Glarea lozoyensis ATCC 20868]|uniref:Thiolase-like protein n=1 Tax=Glarea lozoyensis (strain ATCC 20868 / MF5171) TaxID=1116229 RepID=S3DU94_GLAL2|nr:Thiolase-like protein [Glarea lozoyensis ATCC 20868]EPE29993.1 Thiolase-like protein [Glarea lozoyensis ATCC 20868]
MARMDTSLVSLSQVHEEASENHQFAFPVKWIDTQDALFCAQPNAAITRFVELGPSKVLANMAQRTGDLKYATRDRILGLRRAFLASTKNSPEILYEYEPQTGSQVQGLPSSSSVQSLSAQSPSPITVPNTPATPLHLPTIHAEAFSIAATSLVDVPITSWEIVRALVAHKLKKKIDQIHGSKTIKELSGGKSTLQNEIIGDLEAEFGNTPDGAEDSALEYLAERLQPRHNGQLGKVSSALIARFISSSMPAKFNLKSVRAHLEQTWNLGTSRQSSVLLFAMTLSTTLGVTRLASIAAAKELLDKAAKVYAETCGLTLQAQSNKLDQHVNAESVMSPSAMLSVQQEAKSQRHLATRQVLALSEYLGINLGGNNDSESEVLNRALRNKLAVWKDEFGDDFALGMKAHFDSRLVRRFNFAWNQARQELIALYHRTEIMFEAGNFQNHSNDELQNLAAKVSNKSNADTARLLRALLDSIPERLRDSHPFHKIANMLIQNTNETAHPPPRAKFNMALLMPQTFIGENGSIQYQEVPRTGFVGACYSSLLRKGHQNTSRVCLRRAGSASEEDLNLTHLFFHNISEILQNGANFSGKCILITGAGSGSIGVELVKYLLNGGAHVIVATSRPSSSSSKFYRDIYAEHGSRGSQIHVVPFNQASAIDCKELIEYIHNPHGLAKALDAIIPFAATSEEGVEMDKIDGKSELAHRIMLTNILRILGHISRCKKEQNITCRPTQVILPLSPNHGIFGGDGLYSESKLGLEGLLNRFHSESWSEEITVVGLIIGWTRGTSLMQQNDIVAQAIEERGVLTFSQKEMALNILTLLSPEIAEVCDEVSIIADFSGGLGRLENCNQVLSSAREKIRLESQILKAVREEDRLEAQCCAKLPIHSNPQQVELRTTLRFPFPTLPDFNRDLEQLHHLQKMVDLSGTVVVVGYSELGPWGNARTRWEKESQNRLTQSAYVELAWMMNLIKYFDGDTPQGYFVGWVDTKSGEQVLDSEVEGKYGDFILSHSGIRFIDPDLSSGYDPTKKEFLQEIVVEEDLPEFETDYATAEGIKRRNGDKISFTHLDGQDQCRVQIKCGAHIMVPRSSNFNTSCVAGQLPKGWNAATYGVEEGIISQVDPVTLYALCCVAEALFSAGITNAMEVYKHIHTSEMGNFIGSSMGGTDKTRQMYRDVYLDKRVQGDIIQETFLNTPAAWVNMLLLGSNGPIKTPVGACATGVESIDIGFDSIISGKTKMCIVGGTDNFHEDESYAFSTMKATVNTASELLYGRLPSEMSRPTAESRAGFVESQGCGIQILCSAELAIEMGLPIYGIVAGTTMAADKISRSVPAPGQGVLTFARETPQAVHSPLLNFQYRQEQMQKAIKRAHAGERAYKELPIAGILTPEGSQSDSGGEEQLIIDNSFAESTLRCRIQAVQRQWGNELRRMDPTISPLRASLAVWGLTVDDISVASLHGTSTKANDKNEPDVINQQMRHLGRTGPPLLSICQKSVTGHPKAPASSWMLNGCLQVMNTGLVPGNYNADNVDPALEKFEHLVFPTEPIQMAEIKAFILTSFGFGQKGGQLIGVNPKYLLATLGKDCFEEYATKVTERKRLANRAFAKAVLTNSVFKAQTEPPYDPVDEAKVFLDPLARTSEVPETGEYRFERKNISGSTILTKAPNDASKMRAAATVDLATALTRSQTWISKTISDAPDNVKVGIDVEDLGAFTSDKNEIFVARNYTEDEISVARKSPDPHRSFVGRWCAKEAVFKSLGTRSKGAGAALKEIEIVDSGMGPSVKLHGDAKTVASEMGITGFELSITYTANSVAAIALARKRA